MTDPDQELKEQQRRIEERREELGATVEELSARADVKARAQEKVGELKERAGAKTAELRDKAPAPVVQATEQVRSRPKPVAGAVAAVVVLLVARRWARGRPARRQAKAGKIARKAEVKARSAKRRVKR